jgi:hypothetical protein
VKLGELSSVSTIRYTRYADDLSFSSQEPIAGDFKAAVYTAIKNAGYALNSSKDRSFRKSEARFVTGYVINERVQPPREARRLLRAMFHRLQHGKEITCSLQSMQGWASYVNIYDRDLSKKYATVIASAPPVRRAPVHSHIAKS